MVIQQLPDGSDVPAAGIADNRLVDVVAVVVGRVGNVIAEVVFGDVFRSCDWLVLYIFGMFHVERFGDKGIGKM